MKKKKVLVFALAFSLLLSNFISALENNAYAQNIDQKKELDKRKSKDVSAKIDLNKKDEKIGELTKELQNLKNNISICDDNTNKLKKDLKSVKKYKEKLQYELKILKEKLKSLEVEKKDLLDEIKVLTKKPDKLNNEIINLKEKNKTLEDKILKLNDKLNNKNNEIEKFKVEMLNLPKDIEVEQWYPEKVVKLPNKLSYYDNESLDLDGMVMLFTKYIKKGNKYEKVNVNVSYDEFSNIFKGWKFNLITKKALLKEAEEGKIRVKISFILEDKKASME